MSTHRLSLHLPGGRPFALLLAGFAASSLGDWAYNIALAAVVFDRTGSPTWTGVATAARVVPMVVLGPLGGVIADRRNRRALMIAADLARAVVMVSLAAVAADNGPLVLVPALAALATALGIVTPPCVAASTARLVGDPERQAANAWRAAVGQASVVAGPALGALALLLFGAATAIAFNAVTFVISAAAVAAIGRGEAFAPPAAADGADAAFHPLADIRAGARALRGAPAAVRLVAADVLCSMVYGLLTVALVLVGHRVGAGAGGYGLLIAAFGTGGVAGAAIAGRLDSPGRWRALLGAALVAVALPVAGLGDVTTLGTALALALVGGVGMVVGEVLSETALPRMLDDEVLARAYGLVFPASVAGIVAGSLVAAPLVAWLGVGGALAAAGGFVLLAAALLLRRPLSVPAPALAS